MATIKRARGESHEKGRSYLATSTPDQNIKPRKVYTKGKKRGNMTTEQATISEGRIEAAPIQEPKEMKYKSDSKQMKSEAIKMY